MYYMSTDFGADSLSCFPFRARTNRQTDKQMSKQTNATERPTARRRLYSRRGYLKPYTLSDSCVNIS